MKGGPADYAFLVLQQAFTPSQQLFLADLPVQQLSAFPLQHAAASLAVQQAWSVVQQPGFFVLQQEDFAVQQAAFFAQQSAVLAWAVPSAEKASASVAPSRVIVRIMVAILWPAWGRNVPGRVRAQRKR
jgi:hypothetical protein